MTDTHDGSHTWLKYVSRKEKLAQKALRDFFKEQESGHKFYEKPKWTKEQEEQFILDRPPS